MRIPPWAPPRIHLRLAGETTPGAAPVDPATSESLAALHPGWASDLERFGPFAPCAEANGWASGAEVDAPASLYCVGACDSVLDVAWELAQGGELAPYAGVLTPEQRKGRGRLRREWRSPAGNLYLAWRLPELGADLARIGSIVAGLAVAVGLERMGVPVELKWPNDVLCGRRKVGGILVEERGELFLAGIGLNLAASPAPDEMRAQAAVPAGDLRDAGLGGPVSAWLALAGAASMIVRTALTAGGPAWVLAEAGRRLAFLGERVVLAEGGHHTEGRVVGLAEDGGLRLRTRAGEQVLYSGSISPYA